jgi:sporadic carbohydrate cluster protein (TIGR04323 family)
MQENSFNIKGYTSRRAFSGFRIPIPLQSASIRRYCEDRKYVFNHHVVENLTPDSFLVLERVVTEAALYNGIALCSIGMLPRNTSHRNSLLQRCVDVNVSVHFVFEQYIVRTSSDIAELNELLSMVNILAVSSARTSAISDVLGLP